MEKQPFPYCYLCMKKEEEKFFPLYTTTIDKEPFLSVNVYWVFFRAERLYDALNVLSTMTNIENLVLL